MMAILRSFMKQAFEAARGGWRGWPRVTSLERGCGNATARRRIPLPHSICAVQYTKIMTMGRESARAAHATDTPAAYGVAGNERQDGVNCYTAINRRAMRWRCRFGQSRNR